MQDLQKTLLDADTGSDELLDAVERSIELGMSAEEFDELLEEHWKLVAGEPDLRRLATGRFFIDGRTLGNGGPRKVSKSHLRALPSISNDRHFGKPGCHRKLDAA